MPIRHLAPDSSAIEPTPFAGPDHPMRKVTRQVAFEGAWDAERAEKVAALFDSMASGWTEGRDTPERVASLSDALTRGGVAPLSPVVEVGSGTGIGTRVLRNHFDGTILAIDLAAEMLRHAPPAAGSRVQADASRLPIGDGVAAVVVLVNALLFPDELDRVLAPDGQVVWVNTNGEQTPIHLPAEDVAAALPGQWHGVASRAGTGTWAVLRRAS